MNKQNDKPGKDRITITLRKDLLPLVDNFVDGEKIRNRSHAIEYILGKHLGLGIQGAVILAGADENGVVHALTQVRHRPVIEYTFDLLKSNGIREVIMVIGKKAAPLKEYLGDGSQWRMRITYIDDVESTGTGHALSLVKSYITQTFLLMYSDMLADINLNDFVEHHQQAGTVGTVALTYKKSPEQYGVARMEGNKIVDYEEKPGEDSKHGLVNAGMYLFEPEIFQYLKPSDPSLEQDVLPQVATAQQLTGYPFQGEWFDISLEAGRTTAEKRWS